MPIKGARYAMKKTKKGMMRLAFRGNKVVEAMNMKTGKAHTLAEFMMDAKRAKKKTKVRVKRVKRTKKKTKR